MSFLQLLWVVKWDNVYDRNECTQRSVSEQQNRWRVYELNDNQEWKENMRNHQGLRVYITRKDIMILLCVDNINNLITGKAYCNNFLSWQQWLINRPKWCSWWLIDCIK